MDLLSALLAPTLPPFALFITFYFSLGNLLSILFVILYPFNPASYLEK